MSARALQAINFKSDHPSWGSIVRTSPPSVTMVHGGGFWREHGWSAQRALWNGLQVPPGVEI
eukprot:1159026-Pelagomonas_calceolata.AAC.2